MEANQSITMHDRRRRLCAAHASSLALRPKLLLAINTGCPRPCLPISSFEAASPSWRIFCRSSRLASQEDTALPYPTYIALCLYLLRAPLLNVRTSLSWSPWLAMLSLPGQERKPSVCCLPSPKATANHLLQFNSKSSIPLRCQR